LKNITYYLGLEWNSFNDTGLSLDLINGLLSKRNLPILTLEEYRNVFTFPVKDYYSKAGLISQRNPLKKLAGNGWMNMKEEI